MFRRHNAIGNFARSGKSKVFAYGVESQKAVIAVFSALTVGLRTSEKITQEKLAFRGQSDHCTGCAIDAENKYTLVKDFAESARIKALQIFRRST